MHKVYEQHTPLNTMSPLTLFLVVILHLSVSSIIIHSSKPPYSCSPSDRRTNSLPFCNRTLHISVRVRDLVSRLTVEEKINQLVSSADPIPRLAIPKFQWWSEALHGVSDAGRGIDFNSTTTKGIKAATSFPQVILTAASFDVQLWYRIGQVIGREARAFYNEGQAEGMTLWAPNINIFRDPRWGRGQETPGEDPWLNGQYAVSYVRGVQGDSFDGGALKHGNLLASACCKHFTAYDLESWNGTSRFTFNAQVTAQDLADTFQPPFQSCVQRGQSSGLMCAYNEVNGIPNCANYNLLTEVARTQWSFHGYITSDCLAVQNMHELQGYAKTPEDAVADVLKAGMDVECGSYLKSHTQSALQQKKLDTLDIDRAVHNLFAVRMRLGLFNGDPRSHPFGQIGAKEVCSKEHQYLALEAARHGIVLLKNSAQLLPMPQRRISLAVIGPSANSSTILQGNYYGPPCQSITPLQALEGYVKNLKYQSGCKNVYCTSLDVTSTLKIAKEADYVVLCMGLNQTQEREGLDRNNLLLPGKQQELITSVANVSKKPVILVLLSGGPLDINFAKYHPRIGSILWAGYPGEAGGAALADIIFGAHNPGGKLPVTWYPQEFVELVPMTDMQMRPVPSRGYPGRTYRFYKGNPVFEFGYGLSYSKHVYSFVHVSHKKINLSTRKTMTSTSEQKLPHVRVSELEAGTCYKRRVYVRVGVENLGRMSSKHAVLLFVRRGGEARNDESIPMKDLVGFERVSLEAGERGEVEFTVNPCEHLIRAEKNGDLVVDAGSHFFVVEDQEYPFYVMV